MCARAIHEIKHNLLIRNIRVKTLLFYSILCLRSIVMALFVICCGNALQYAVASWLKLQHNSRTITSLTHVWVITVKENGKTKTDAVTERNKYSWFLAATCLVLQANSKLCSWGDDNTGKGYLAFIILENMAMWRTNVITYICISSVVVLILLGFHS